MFSSPVKTLYPNECSAPWVHIEWDMPPSLNGAVPNFLFIICSTNKIKITSLGQLNPSRVAEWVGKVVECRFLKGFRAPFDSFPRRHLALEAISFFVATIEETGMLFLRAVPRICNKWWWWWWWWWDLQIIPPSSRRDIRPPTQSAGSPSLLMPHDINSITVSCCTDGAKFFYLIH